MPIFANNIIVGGVNKTPPVVETKDEEKQIVEEKPTYHEIHDGDLHKLINRKSSYLTDMINLQK